MLIEVMKHHRISPTDINAAFRQEGVLDVCQVECGIIEPNGTISVFTMKALKDAKAVPDVLTSIPQYKKLCDRADEVGVDDAAAEEGTGDEETENGRKRSPV